MKNKKRLQRILDWETILPILAASLMSKRIYRINHAGAACWQPDGKVADSGQNDGLEQEHGGIARLDSERKPARMRLKRERGHDSDSDANQDRPLP
jgi:hypothetical protein